MLHPLLEHYQHRCLVIDTFNWVGVFFNYDISPMLVKYEEYRKPLSHFLTDICAVVGGVFTVAGIVDGILYSTSKRMAKKTEIGKDG